MMGNSGVYARLLKNFATPTTFYQTGLLHELGYRETPELISRMNDMRLSLKTLNNQLFWLELEANGEKNNFILRKLVPVGILVSLVMIILLKLVWEGCRCCCGLRKKLADRKKKRKVKQSDSLEELARAISGDVVFGGDDMGLKK